MSNRMIVKEDLRKIVKMWDDKTAVELSEELGISKNRLFLIAKLLRQSGVKLVSKRVNGQLSALIKEFVEERR